MKNNLKTKVMLAVLAGGMLCMGSVFAGAGAWYGKTGSEWTVVDTEAGTSGLMLTVVDGQTVGGCGLTEISDIYGGYTSGSEEVKNNSITFNTTNETSITAQIYGGQSDSGNATNNSVTINNGTFSNYVHGGRSSSGNATNNSLTINGGIFNGDIRIYGGSSDNGAVTGNSVIINGGTFHSVFGCIYGGNGATANGNRLVVNGGMVLASVYGGRGFDGVAINNEVIINDGTICGVLGAHSYNSNAENNTVTINGGTFVEYYNLYGGICASGKTSSGNILNLKTAIGIKAATVNYFQAMNFTIPKGMDKEMPMLNVYQSVALHDAANRDIAFTTDLNGMTLAEGDYITLIKNVDDTSFTPATSGLGHYVLTIGDTKELVYSNGTPVAKADFEITTNGVKSAVDDKYYSDGESETDTIDNTKKEYDYIVKGNVNLTDGTATDKYSNNEVIFRRGTYGYVFGAELDSEGEIPYDVTNNKLTVYGGTFGGYVEGGSNSYEGCDATGNSVTIYDGTFSTCVAGGHAKSGIVSENTVTIYNGTFNDNMWICGGYCGSPINNSVTINGGNFSAGVEIYGGWSDGGNATGNIVTIEGGTFSDGFKLYGGYTTGISSGNILNLKTKIGGKATDVKYFQEMNFTLPVGIQSGDTMLSTQNLGVNASGGEAKVNVYAANGVTLNKGDIITLVNVDADGSLGGTFTGGTILGGAADFYFEGAEGGVDKNGDSDKNDLVIVLTKDFEQKSGGDAATTKAIAEGIAASLAFVNQGADMVAGSGIDGLYVADSENPTIAAFSGNKTRYNTGSHVDIHGWNALAGVALNNKASFSHGVFVEIGNGDIDTYAALNGSGSSDYKGGGYMLRKDMGKGWTIDGAVRAGRVETSWSNNDKGGYEAKQTYYGAHVTFNKMLKEYGEQKLNGYLRYTFTHLGSDSVSLDGTHYGFDSVNSHRTRLGARMVDEGQNGFELYYGAAWEYGFGGDCDATVNGVTTSGPAVDGSNGVFEVGGTWSDKKWEISAGLEGYVGAKRGVAGGMNFIYKF